MSNKRVAVKSVFVRQRASLVEGETKEQRLVRLEKEKKRKRLSRQNESDEQRQKRLEAQRKRNRVRLQIETSDQRYHRLHDLRDRANERRQNACGIELTRVWHTNITRESPALECKLTAERGCKILVVQQLPDRLVLSLLP